MGDVATLAVGENMSEVVERVAAAIAEKYAPAVDQHAPYAKIMMREAAKAAIEAMREPTEVQYEALCATGLMWRDLNSTKVWQTYIDAALT